MLQKVKQKAKGAAGAGREENACWQDAATQLL